MELNLTDLECQRTAADTFRCVAEQPAPPQWFYPVVIACFVLATLVFLMLAKLVFVRSRKHNRRETDPDFGR